MFPGGGQLYIPQNGDQPTGNGLAYGARYKYALCANGSQLG